MNEIVDFFRHIFNSSDWPARLHCGTWTDFHVWLYVISDLLIWSAYFAIPFVIIRYISRKKSIQFTKLYFLFAAFILACGATHFLDAVAFWIPLYRLSGLVRFITGVISWVTVFYLAKYLPVLFSLRSQAALEAEIDERKKTELALKKSRKDYELLVGGVKDYAIFMLDTEGRVASWNSGAENIKGYSAAEIIGKPMDIFYPDEKIHQGEPKRNLDMALQHGRYETKGLRVRKDKSVFWADIVFSALYDEANTFYGYAKVTRDITDRKQAEDNLKEFEYFFSNSNDLFCIANNDGYFEIVNPSFTKILGYSENELSKNPFIDFVHPDDIAATLEAYGQLKSGAALINFINRYRKKDGNYLWLDWNATPNASTGKLYCIARDITERKKAEDALNKLNEELEQKVIERTEKLAASEMRFRMLIENSADGIALSDEFSNNIYRSPGAIKITGILPKENQMVFTHPDDVETIKQKQEELLKKPGVPIPFQARFRHALGHYIWLEGTLTNLLQVEGMNAIINNFRDITPRKEMEVLLNKANSMAHIGSWEVDLIKGTVFWSDITKDIHETGYDFVPDLKKGINFYKEGPGRNFMIKKVEEAIEQGMPWDVELQIITAKNNERWVRSIGETEFADGKCIRIYGSFQDIDKRKKVEEALLLSEAKARRIFESDMIGFLFWSEKGLILEANDYFLNMTGYTRQDLEKGLVNWAAMTPPEYAYLDIISIQQIEATGSCKPFEKEYIRKDGSRFPVIMGAAALGENFDGVGVCYVMDITERKNAEIERDVLSERLQLATQSAQLGLWDWDVKNDKLIWDEGMYKLYNISENEFTTIYDGWASRVHEEDRQRVDNEIQLALENKKDYNPAFRIVWADSSVHYINASGIVERDNAGNAVRMTGFNWDVTERKTAEEKIKNINIELEEKVINRTEQLQAANKELESFSYSVSHDLRAPLRAVHGYTKMLKDGYETLVDAEGIRLMNNIMNNAKKMGQLIDDLLTFSRIGRHEILQRDIPMQELVTAICNELKEEQADRSIEFNIKNLFPAPTDNTAIKQVWLNLISNALKYSKQREKSIIEIGSEEMGDEIIYHIKDNGAGFDMRYADKLFGIFQRLHSDDEFEGTGVGLAIVQRIIFKHGGRIWAEGKVGEGAIFYFSLYKS